MKSTLKSFASFAETRKQLLADKAKLEANGKRDANGKRYAELLAQFEVADIRELDEENRSKFLSALLSEEDIATEGNAFGAAVKKAKEDGEDEFEVDGETYKVESTNEGRAFVAAVARAREAGEKTFEFNGKTYKVKKAKIVNERELNEGVNAKIKKAMKAVDKGETVYGENVRFPGRFKILRFTMGGAMAVVDYEDGTKPFEMAAMNIAIDKIKFESVVEKKSLNEAIKVERKRSAKKVVTQLNKLLTKQLPDLQQMGKVGIYGCLKYLLSECMEDANFHTERASVVKSIRKASIPGIEVKLPGLGGYHAKIGGSRVKDILFNYVSQISLAADWGGQALVEGFALYISQFHKDDATATAMITAFNAHFEGEEVRVDVSKKIKAINESIDFENIFEAEIKDDESFIDYVKTVYAEAFGEDYDEDKATKAAEGMLKKADGDYGAAVGMCKASMG
jgi:hypothetical protein